MICPALYWSNNNIILNKCGFRCNSPAHSHFLSNKSRLPQAAALCRMATDISSSHQGLFALLWTPPADPLISLYCLCMLCGRWRYFHPNIRLGIYYSLTSLELGAIPHPNPQLLYHITMDIIHIFPFTMYYICNCVAVETTQF